MLRGYFVLFIHFSNKYHFYEIDGVDNADKTFFSVYILSMEESTWRVFSSLRFSSSLKSEQPIFDMRCLR